MNMRALSRIGLGATALLLVAVAAQPAQAACPPPYAIDHISEWVVSNPDWPAGAYYTYYIPATSPNLTGVFWALTGGDPTVGVGNDNGALNFNFTEETAYMPYWEYSHFPMTINAGLPMSWGPASVDGCIDATGSDSTLPDAQQCTCMLLTDEWNGAGYYAVLSKFVATDLFTYVVATQDSDKMQLSSGEPKNDIILSPVPRPAILGSTGDASGKILNVVANDTSVDNVDPCNCLQGYKIYGVVQPSNSMAPPRDLANWTELASGAGTAQQTTQLGMPTSVRVDCGVGQQAYIATVATFDSGYRGHYVSSDAVRVNCDPNVADPQRPDRPGTRPDLPDSRPRPRGEARGR